MLQVQQSHDLSAPISFIVHASGVSIIRCQTVLPAVNSLFVLAALCPCLTYYVHVIISLSQKKFLLFSHLFGMPLPATSSPKQKSSAIICIRQLDYESLALKIALPLLSAPNLHLSWIKEIKYSLEQQT